MCKSLATVPKIGPLRPPIKKTEIAPNTKSIGVGVVIFPPHKVATHEKNAASHGFRNNRSR